MTDTVLGWHFTSQTLKDGRPVPPVGEWLRHDGRIVLRKSGLHMSRRIIEALEYASGPFIHRVEGRGDIQEENGTLVCRERRILCGIDGRRLLREFARDCALAVIHLWDAPDITRHYLGTLDENIRREVWRAAWGGTLSIAQCAAVSVSVETSWNGAWYAAKYAADALNQAGDAKPATSMARFNARLEAMFWAEAERQGDAS